MDYLPKSKELGLPHDLLITGDEKGKKRAFCLSQEHKCKWQTQNINWHYGGKDFRRYLQFHVNPGNKMYWSLYEAIC